MVNGPGSVIFTGPLGPRAQEPQVVDLDRPDATDAADHARDGVRPARAARHHRRVVDVEALQRGREAVRVALAPDLAVGDDVEPGAFLGRAIASAVASSCACARSASGTRHSSRARTRGGSDRPAADRGRSASPAGGSCRSRWWRAGLCVYQRRLGISRFARYFQLVHAVFAEPAGLRGRGPSGTAGCRRRPSRRRARRRARRSSGGRPGRAAPRRPCRSRCRPCRRPAASTGGSAG